MPHLQEKRGITISGRSRYAPGGNNCSSPRQQRKNLNTAIETSGYFDKEFLPVLCKYTDTFLWDFKDSDNARHIENTGVSNEQIIENLLM